MLMENENYNLNESQNPEEQPSMPAEHLYLELVNNNSNLDNSSVNINNISRRVNNAIKESFYLNSLFLLISLTKIIILIYEIVNEFPNEPCQGSLRIWLLTMLIHDILNFLGVFLLLIKVCLNKIHIQNTINNDSFNESFRNFDLTFHSQIRRRMGSENSFTGFDINNNVERYSILTAYLLEFCRFSYLLVFLFGNVIFFSETSCTKGHFFNIPYT